MTKICERHIHRLPALSVEYGQATVASVPNQIQFGENYSIVALRVPVV